MRKVLLPAAAVPFVIAESYRAGRRHEIPPDSGRLPAVAVVALRQLARVQRAHSRFTPRPPCIAYPPPPRRTALPALPGAYLAAPFPVALSCQHKGSTKKARRKHRPTRDDDGAVPRCRRTNTRHQDRDDSRCRRKWLVESGLRPGISHVSLPDARDGQDELRMMFTFVDEFATHCNPRCSQ